MKRLFALLLSLLLLWGCAVPAPRTETGEPWQETWQEIGPDMGIAPVGDGLTLYEYNDVQAIDGIYYAAWTAGESKTITNDSGKEAELFPLQVYLLVQDSDSAAEAASAILQWHALAEAGYGLKEAPEAEGLSCYELIPGEASPFTGGYLALGCHGRFAVSVEVMYTEDHTGDPRQVTERFLRCLRFRERED